jgi:hypothetical protein
MALSQTVEISEKLQRLPQELQERAIALKGAKLNTQIARGVQQLFMAHFFDLDKTRANPFGAAVKTHFYGDAAKATSSSGTDSEAIVTVAQQGIRQRLEGGTIRAKPGGWLTIPARARGVWQTGARISRFAFREVEKWQRHVDCRRADGGDREDG